MSCNILLESLLHNVKIDHQSDYKHYVVIDFWFLESATPSPFIFPLNFGCKYLRLLLGAPFRRQVVSNNHDKAFWKLPEPEESGTVPQRLIR